MKLYTIRVTGAPALGPFSKPVIRSRHASNVGGAIGKVLGEIEGLERFLRRGDLYVKVEHRPVTTTGVRKEIHAHTKET